MQVKYFKALAMLIFVVALVNNGMAQRKKQVRSGSAYGNSAYGNTNNVPADTTRKGNNNQSGYGNNTSGYGNNNTGNQPANASGYGNAAPANNGIDTTLPFQNVQSSSGGLLDSVR